MILQCTKHCITLGMYVEATSTLHACFAYKWQFCVKVCTYMCDVLETEWKKCSKSSTAPQINESLLTLIKSFSCQHSQDKHVGLLLFSVFAIVTFQFLFSLMSAVHPHKIHNRKLCGTIMRTFRWIGASYCLAINQNHDCHGMNTFNHYQ